MHAFLLINSDPNQFAKKQNSKIVPFILQKIEDVRELKKLVKFSFSQKTAILIENIDNVTQEAANAFLKNLEEPNNNLIYILTASNLSNVLPTIISRCEVVRSQTINHKSQITEVNYKSALIIKDREEAIKFVENLANIDYKKQIFKNMDNYLITLKNLKLNGNVSLQMTNLVARMNSDGK